MKVLYVCYQFPPYTGAGVFRPVRFLRHFSANGLEATVVCAGRDMLLAKDPELETKLPAGLRVVRVDDPESHALRRLLARTGLMRAREFPDRCARWATHAASTIRRLAPAHDIVFASAPPFSTGLAVLSAGLPVNLPLVVEYRDEFSANLLSMEHTPSGQRGRAEEWERTLLRRANHIVTISGGIASRVAQIGQLPPARVTVIENGYDESDFADMPARQSGKFKVVYAGYLYAGRSPEAWWRALAAIRQEQPEVAAKMDVHVLGRMAVEYTRLLDSLGLRGWVNAPGQVSQRVALEAVCTAHQAVVLSESVAEASDWPGGKIYECLRSGATLLVTGSAGSAKDKLLNLCSAGAVVPTDDIEAIKRRTLADFDTWQRGEWKPREVTAEIQRFESRSLTARLADTLRRVMNNS